MFTLLKLLQDHVWSNILFAPPLNKTSVKERRCLARQQKARCVSSEIDKGILQSKKLLEKKKKAIKVLLLGQPESDRMTMLRHLQFALCPTYFHSETLRWKTIIQLNLISCVKKLLSIVEDELEMSGPCSRSPTDSTSASLPDHYRRTRMRLLSLLSMETNLKQQLHPENCSVSRTPEICTWTAVLEKVSFVRCGQMIDERNEDHPALVLAAFKHDIISLWEDEAIQALLKRRGIRLEDSPGFYLNDTARIATVDYVPTEEDIVRARSPTSGVEEHHIIQDNGSEWYIYNFGGNTRVRQWAPYLDDVQAIIFLAPLAFNEALEEDNPLNRLQHSMYLWREICGNPFLAGANMTLVFNKMDVLKQRLDGGTKVETYFPGYGSTPDDVEHAGRYFRKKFAQDHYQLSPQWRLHFTCATSVIDMKTAEVVLVNIRDGILSRMLERSRILLT